MIVFFKILLVFIAISGFIFGVKLFNTNQKLQRKKIFIDITFGLLMGIPTLVLVLYFFSLQDLAAYKTYIISINIFYIICSLLSALSAEYLLKRIESLIKTRLLFLIVRFIILIYSIICISTSCATTKASFYFHGTLKYKFSNELNQILENNTKDKIVKFENKIDNCNSWLLKVRKLGAKTLYIKRKNLFSYFSGNYTVLIDTIVDFDLEYHYKRGTVNNPFPTHNFVFISKRNNNNVLITNAGPIQGERLDSIRKKTIENSIIMIQNTQSTYINGVKKAKPTFYIFALAAFGERFYYTDYNIEVIGKKSKNIDTSIDWLFYILTMIVFFEFIKNWTKNTADDKVRQ